MEAAEQRPRCRVSDGIREPRRQVLARLRGGVDQKLALGLGRPSRHQIDHASERRRPIQRGGGALDDLDLREIEGRHLQQAERVSLRAVQRQAIGDELRVAAAQALNAHVGRAERRRGGLHAQARCFTQEHGDAAGRHQRLLFDLFAVDHFDAHRLILQTRVRPCRGDDDGLFGLRNPRERDPHGRRAVSVHARHGVSQADVLGPRQLMSYSPGGTSNAARPCASEITVRPFTTTDAPWRGRSSDTTSTRSVEPGRASCASARRKEEEKRRGGRTARSGT